MITKEYLQQELTKRIDGYKRGVETSTDNIIAEMKSILVLVDALPDYEKKYNEALKWMRELYPGLHGATKEDAEHFFPELRESEDERIRKKCIVLIKRVIPSGDNQSQESKEILDCIAYLEKQKEQKPVDYDHEMWKNCVANFAGGKKEVIEHPERYGLQKPAEWSEEDNLMLTAVIQTLENFGPYGTIGMQIDWLKSLRPSWKPSEEQMNCLCAAVDAAIRKHNESVSGYKPARVLKSLYEDLQKL